LSSDSGSKKQVFTSVHLSSHLIYEIKSNLVSYCKQIDLFITKYQRCNIAEMGMHKMNQM